jgi:aspartate/methionine/tyrosine aminotransferase
MERMQSRFENYVEYNLSESGVQPMAPAEILGDAAGRDAFLAAGLGYVQSNGSEPLRERIATFYEGAGRDNILVTNGGSEANYATFWALLERGDRVAYMLPNYLQTWGLARAWAGRADPFHLEPMDDGRGGRRWGLDVEALDRAVTRSTKIILVTNPNNPTGAVLTEGEMDAVVRAARRVRAYIVADEIYRGAEMHGPTTPSFWGRYDRVIITSGLSKAFGLPGLRIGWIAGPPKLVERIWSYRDYTTIAPGMLSDLLARRVMEPAGRAAIFERTRAIMRRHWPILEGFIGARRDLLSVIPPCAGAIAFVRYDLPIGSIALADRLRTEKSVLIVPGDQVGVPRHIRIGFGYGTDHHYLLAGLERIGALLRELSPGRRPAAARRPAKARRPTRPVRPAAAVTPVLSARSRRS